MLAPPAPYPPSVDTPPAGRAQLGTLYEYLAQEKRNGAVVSWVTVLKIPGSQSIVKQIADCPQEMAFVLTYYFLDKAINQEMAFLSVWSLADWLTEQSASQASRQTDSEVPH